MNSKIKNIILFIIITAILILVYIFFIKKSPEEQNLVSSTPISIDGTTTSNTNILDKNSSITKDFLSVLLSVKSIRLDDSIFGSAVFNNLRDSSILLTPSGNEGRPNPFAPIGSEPAVATPISTPNSTPAQDPLGTTPVVCVLPEVLDTMTNTCTVPIIECILPEILNPTTNKCVTPVKCKLPKVLNPMTNKCVTPVKCKLPKVIDIGTNKCVTPETTPN